MKFRNIQGHFGRFAPHRLLCLTLVFAILTNMVGCNYVILLSYLIHGPPSIAPGFETETGQSMTEEDVTVAVFCFAPKEIKFDFDKIDHDLARAVSFRLGQHNIRFVNPDYVQAWTDRNPDWDHAHEIGEAFQTRYVVYIDLHEYNLYEHESSTLYRGRAEAIVKVFEMDEAYSDGELIYQKDITSKFPLLQGRSTSEVTYSTFKREFVGRLSEEIGRLFYEHYAGSDVVDAT